MNRNKLILVAAGGSAALLLGAFIFQLFGYPPCKMCLWQRWPHAIAIPLGLAALIIPGRILPLLGATAVATTAGIGLFHTGVERDWWEGPTSCTSNGGGLGNIGGADLLSVDGPLIVMCDQVSWELFTLSMASWNALFSLGLVAIWLMAARR